MNRIFDVVSRRAQRNVGWVFWAKDDLWEIGKNRRAFKKFYLKRTPSVQEGTKGRKETESGCLEEDVNTLLSY